MITADRVMKGRRGGQCALCPAAVTVGQQIGRIAAGVWAHTACIIATRSAELAELRDLMIQPPRPSERGGQVADQGGKLMTRWIPPIEGMRVGGLPADAGPPRPPTPEETDEAIRDYAWDLKATGGRYEDGTPRVAAVDSGGTVHFPHIRKTARCPVCEREYITAEHLAAHREADHQGADDGPA